MGIVAEYLSQADKLLIRGLNEALKREVDCKIETLTLSAQDAVSLFIDAQDLPHLKQLHLVNWNDQDLIDVATTLTALSLTPFELVLAGQPGQHAPNLQCLATLNLSGLALYNLRITPETSNALCAADFAIAVVFPATGLMRIEDVDAIIRIPTLSVLRIGFSPVSDTIAEALRRHPSLTAFACRRINGYQLRLIMGNPQLQSFSVDTIEDGSDADFIALATHPALRSLALSAVEHAQDLMTLSSSTPIAKLQLGLKVGAIASLPYLANMPALRELTLSGIFFEDRIATLTASDIEAICRKPLAALEFRFFEMRGPNFVMAASAHASTLRFQCWPGTSDLVIDDHVIDAIADNHAVSSLSLTGGHIVEGGAARLAAIPQLDTLTLDLTSAAETAETVRRAWTDAAKPLVNLKCVIGAPRH